MPSDSNDDEAVISKPTADRADEVLDLLRAVEELLIPFIAQADKRSSRMGVNGTDTTTAFDPPTLVDYHPPNSLVELLDFNLPISGGGKDGLLNVLKGILQFSVNTWDRGFMDKLYASTNAVGVASELILTVLNTNVHVYHVSPALTVIEKVTSRHLSELFGLRGPFIGGVSQQGGSASNTTSLVIARNTLFPSTKVIGTESLRLALFTSVNGHYSILKAAMVCGLGTASVWRIPVDEKGRMDPEALDKTIEEARTKNFTPFYVNATAGTTVLGAYDPLNKIADICQKHKLWMHVDGSLGGSAVFSNQQRHKLQGAERADSITINPHKMMGVPIPCSFLLGADMRKFHTANSLEADYLFHENDDQGEVSEVWDLANYTLQCGRRGESLNLALGWIYYGQEGYGRQIDHAFQIAAYFSSVIRDADDFILISEDPPPCLQVCFYFAPDNKMHVDPKRNTEHTQEIVRQLIAKGYMIDYAPGERGSFLRAVVNIQTQRETINNLVEAIRQTST